MSKQHTTLDINGMQVEVSNLQKVFYPDTGFTKGQVIDYYINIADAILPHLKDRALTLKRYPNGVEAAYFYERQCPSHRPRWIATTTVPKKDGQVKYCVMNDLPSLVWAANLADLEIHTFLHRMDDTGRPTAMAFDLDPGPPADVLDCAKVALALRKVFQRLKLDVFVKTSGSKGLQVYLPLNTAVDYEATKAAAHHLADEMAGRFERQVVSNMLKKLRKNKVLIDWSQNDDHKTTVCVYSLRARTQPTVSTPVAWDLPAKAVREKDASLLSFTHEQALARYRRHGDLFEPVLKLKQKLPSLKAITQAVEALKEI